MASITRRNLGSASAGGAAPQALKPAGPLSARIDELEAIMAQSLTVGRQVAVSVDTAKAAVDAVTQQLVGGLELLLEGLAKRR